MFLSFSRWLAKAKSQIRKPRRAATVRKRFVPQIEQLETRLAPAINLVQNIGMASGPGASFPIPVTKAVAAGDTVIVEFIALGTVSVSDSAGNSYSMDVFNNFGNPNFYVFSASNVKPIATGGNITVNLSGASGCLAVAQEFSGLADTNALDKTAYASGVGTAPSSGATPTTTQANELLLGAIYFRPAGLTLPSFTPGPGYTALTPAQPFLGEIAPEYQVVSATAAYQANGTLTTGTLYLADIATFRAAPSLVVTNTNDSGPGSLRAAISAGNVFGDGTITFAPNVTGSINLTSQLPSIAGNVTIQGPGANVLTVNGQGHGSVFSISSGTVAINGLTITGGVGNGNSAGEGGGVFINSGTVSLTNDVITNNSAVYGGGVINFGTATLTDDTIANNKASSDGGGIYNGGGSMTVVSSTITGNNGLSSGGGGILNNQARLALLNDTITANTTSNFGGGIRNGISASNGSTVQDIFDTIIDGNSAGAGPDVYNSSGNTFTSGGNNLYGSSSNVTWAGSDIQNASPLLGALQNNGGPTPTIAELPGSPALGAGNTTSAPPTDQRGYQRIINGKIDIGAFENQSQLFTLTAPTSEPTVDAGQNAAFNLGSFSYSGNAGNVWKVDVNWGDGSPDTIFTTLTQGSLGTQNHTYAASGNYFLTIAVFDGNGNFIATPQPSTIQVTVSQALAIAGPIGLPAGTAGSTYPGANFTATGGTGTKSFTATSGGLTLANIDGLTLSSSGSLSGTPIAVGNFNFTVVVKDGNLNTASRNYTLTVSAPSLLVTNTNDAGPGSLRQAISNANLYYTNGTITFAPYVTGTITLTSGRLDSSNGNLTIQGPGAGVLAVSGDNQYEVFNLSGGNTYAISGLTISGGNATTGGGISIGAGDNVTLTNDTISGNQATTGAGIYNNGTLTLTSDTLTGNSAGYVGGGIYNNFGTVTLTNCTLTGNSAANAGGGIDSSGGNLTLTNCTLAGNSASAGGGINSGSTLKLTNDTLSGNKATTGGGIFLAGGTVTLTNDTLASNSASGKGGGIYNSGGNLSVFDSIVAGNTGPNITGSFTDSGGNLLSGNPLLGPLQNNGGPTQTFAELPGSPALGAGNTAGAPPTDQRGFQRIINGKIDIGAFENQSQWFTQTAPTAGGTYYATRPATFNLGSFTYSGSAPSVWHVDVSWGDGASTDFTTLSQGSLGSQSHAYAAAGNFQITVTVSDADSNFHQASSSSFTVNAAPVATYVNVVGSATQSTTVGTQFATPMEVQVLDQYLNPVPGVTVLFSAVSGTNGASGAFANGTANTLATTDANGDATATTFTANYAAGTYPVYASTSGVGTPAIFTLTNIPGLVTQLGVYFSVPGTVSAGQKFNVLVEAQDSHGNLVTTDTDSVKLTSTDPKQPLNLTQALVSGETTFSGVEQDTAGTQTLTATDTTTSSITGTRNVTVQPSAPTIPTIMVTAGNNQSALVNTTFAANLAATVTDQFGNPVPNVTVVFAAPGAGPSGAFSGSASVTTNASGLATAPTFTANLLAGTYTVTASVSGAGSPANFTLTNTSPLGSSANDIYVENVYGLLLHRVADSGASYWVNQLNAGTAPAMVVQDIEGSTEYRDDLVQALYQHYLGRPAGSGDQSYWSGQLAGNTIESVTATILASPEYFNDASDNNTTFVQHLYQQVLGRTGSITELQAWVNVLNSGATRYQVAFAFLTTQEYRADLLNGGTWVPYNPLTNWGGYYPEFLLRPADPGGLAFWAQQLSSGMTDQAVLAAIFGYNEGYNRWS